MNDTRPAQKTTPPVRGSYEALLTQAQQYAANFNDEAIPIFQKLLDALSRLPQPQRLAADGRLQKLLTRTAMDYQGYLNARERYTDALVVLKTARDLIDEDDRDFWDDHINDVYILAGQPEEALTRLTAVAEAPDGELGDWGHVVMTYLRLGRPGEARPILARLTADLEQSAVGVPAASDRDVEMERQRAYILGLEALVDADAGEWDAAIAHFEQVMELGGAYSQNPQLFYSRLAAGERYEDALRFIGRDEDHPVRAGFWHGIVLERMGRTARAQDEWRTVTTQNLAEKDPNSFFEFIMSYYGLGDPQGTGLGMVLRTLREQRVVPWILLMLAGLGWAVRKDYTTAANDLNLAVAQRRAAADGRLLPYHFWWLAQTILDAESQAAVAPYFEQAPVAVRG